MKEKKSLKERIKGFFKTVGEKIKKIATKVMEFFRKHAERIVSHLAGVGIDVLLLGAVEILWRNKALCAALGFNLGPVGAVFSIFGVLGLSVVLQHSIDHYISNEMHDIFDTIDEIKEAETIEANC